MDGRNKRCGQNLDVKLFDDRKAQEHKKKCMSHLQNKVASDGVSDEVTESSATQNLRCKNSYCHVQLS
jgi:hypothetical protein